jgi:hypothetical protein
MGNHFRGKLFDPSKSLDNSKTSSCTYYLHYVTFVRDWQRGSRLVFSQTGFGARSEHGHTEKKKNTPGCKKIKNVVGGRKGSGNGGRSGSGMKAAESAMEAEEAANKADG